ncbi:MAG TPA: 50S ribosomal protein L4 [candidate division Zixibacteria bacterium]|nr:50S ribosomal protein L4 [candidate division Zixibacteria bacterium]
MIKAKLYDIKGNPAGEIELPENAFGIEPNVDVLWQYVKMYLANQRQGTHSAKTRGEVSGGGRKPWRQKGTGRARHGSIRSPIWRKGGVVFPPKPRDYRLRMPKKMRRLALASILSDRARENKVFVFEGFDLPKPRTKDFINILDNSEIDYKVSTLVITRNVEPNVIKSAKNIPKVKVTFSGELNPYQVITAENIIIEKSALEKIEELCQR